MYAGRKNEAGRRHGLIGCGRENEGKPENHHVEVSAIWEPGVVLPDATGGILGGLAHNCAAYNSKRRWRFQDAEETPLSLYPQPAVRLQAKQTLFRPSLE